MILLDAAPSVRGSFGDRLGAKAQSRLDRIGVEVSGAELLRAGRIGVQPDLTLPGYPEVLVVGDLIALDGLPRVAQVAIQGGRHAARVRCRPDWPGGLMEPDWP